MMVLPQTPEVRRLCADLCAKWVADQDKLLRDLLGQWVSGLEPEIIYGYGSLPTIRGIGIAGDYSGRIVVLNRNWSPGLIDRLYAVHNEMRNERESLAEKKDALA